MLQFKFVSHYLEILFVTAKNPSNWGIVALCNLIAVKTLQIFIEQYVFSQWHFAIAFIIIWIIDTFNGTYIAIRKGEYSGKIFREKLFDKMVAYISIIVAFSAGTKMMLQDSDFNLIVYLNVPFYSLFIAVEIRSIIWNWYRFKKWEWLGDLLQMIDKKNNPITHKNEKEEL